MRIGIDASRNRSGGAKAHIIGILNALNKKLPLGVSELHIWSYPELLEKLPSFEGLYKHTHTDLSKGLLSQIVWQRYKLPKAAKKLKIEILLNTDAGTVCRFLPAVTMSRDMLSYESGEMRRYGLSLQRLRLLLLKFAQNFSLRHSTGAIFLTKYAADTIQKSSGKVKDYCIVHHGISENFRLAKAVWKDKDRSSKPISCVYVSNVAPYKHQIHVLDAIRYLREEKNLNLTITLIGGGEGAAQKEVEKFIQINDPKRLYSRQTSFVKHDTLPNLINQADLFIFASSCENMPNTLIEGMCSGLPIVCSNRGPMPEVLKNGGLYFDPENYLDIATAIEKMVLDEELRKEKARISLNLSHGFSWDKCARETFDYLIKTAKNNGKDNISNM